MELVVSIHPVWVGERRCRFLERNLVLAVVCQGFAKIPLKHFAVYTLTGSPSAICPSAALMKGAWSLSLRDDAGVEHV